MKYTQAVRIHKNWLLKKISSTEWEVMEEFIWYIDFDSKNTYVIVPKGFITNFWSIPRIMQSIFQPTKYLWYVLHDRLYDKDWEIIYEDKYEMGNVNYTRKEADKILLESSKVEWAWFIERYCIYLGVRLWGFNHYNR